MSKFAEECKKRIAEAGVKPRELKVEVNFIPSHGGRKLYELRKIKPIFIERMEEELKNPSECQKLYEANLQLEAVKKEANYWETKCEKITELLLSTKVKVETWKRK